MRAKRSDEIKSEEEETPLLLVFAIQTCRVSTARGWHVTSNIGHKPKLITTPILEMSCFFLLSSEKVDALHASSLTSTSIWYIFSSLNETNQFLLYLLGFVPQNSALLSEVLGKLGQQAAASGRFRIVAWSENGNAGRARGKTKKRQRETRYIRFERMKLAF